MKVQVNKIKRLERAAQRDDMHDTNRNFYGNDVCNKYYLEGVFSFMFCWFCLHHDEFLSGNFGCKCRPH